MKLIAILLCLGLVGCSQQSPQFNEVVKTGEVENVLYLQGGWAESSKTVIYFTDKTTYILYGDYQIPYKKIVIKRGQDGLLGNMYNIEEQK